MIRKWIRPHISQPICAVCCTILTVFGMNWHALAQNSTPSRQFIPTPTMDWKWDFTHSSGTFMQLQLRVNPKGAFSDYYVALPLPAGVEVVAGSLNHGGVVEDSMIKWGIFEDNMIRTFSVRFYSEDADWGDAFSASGVFNENINVQYQDIPMAQNLFVYRQSNEPMVYLKLLSTPNAPNQPRALEESSSLNNWKNSFELGPNQSMPIGSDPSGMKVFRLK